MSKILVVDDDQESRDLLCEVLEASGYTAVAVADGSAARKALDRDGDFRIVIADLRMPNESGLDLLRSLRQREKKCEVILMSSYMSRAQRRAAAELEAYALLDKPFRLAELLQAVAEITAKKPVGASARANSR